MIELVKDNYNKELYYIKMIANDKLGIYLGTFTKSNCKAYNNILNLYSSSEFKINSCIFRNIATALENKFGDIDFAIITSEVFTLFEDKERYIYENIRNL